MQQSPESFFKHMRQEDSHREIPSFERMARRPATYRWLYGVAAVITLLAVILVFIDDSPEASIQDIILDTGNSPTVTESLSAPQEEEFLDWEAPTDYLSNDFND